TALFQEALCLFRERGESAGIAHCLLGLADVALAGGETLLAARWLGAAEQLPRHVGGGRLWSGEPNAYESLPILARARLGDAVFEEAFAEGQALAPEQIVAEASVLGEGGRAPTRLRPRRQMA